MVDTVTAYKDSRDILHDTLAEAEAADRYYTADDLFATHLDPTRDNIQFATLDELILMRPQLEAIFAALDP